MSNKYTTNKNAIADCDVCGFQFKLKTLKSLFVRETKTNILACTECWNPDQPQLKLGEFPVNDPQAIRDPRSDIGGLVESRDTQWGWNPVGVGRDTYGLTPNDLVGTGVVGTVTVTTS